MHSPLFTQKHYEYVIAKLHEDLRADEDVVNILCDIFKQDNPKFKGELFRRMCLVTGLEGESE